MPFILNFIERNSKALLFLLLLFISLGLMFQSQAYHHSKLYSGLFQIQSQVGSKYSSIKDYFKLQRENETLLEENKKLKQQNFNLQKRNNYVSQKIEDTLLRKEDYKQVYDLVTAEVVNSVQRDMNNYYTIDVGSQDGIQEGLGVITSEGIVGHIAMVNDEYALVLSALHPETKIKSKIKNTEYYGTLVWNGTDTRIMNLKNIDKYIDVNVNDTIQTYKSTIYPEGIAIGTVIDKKVDKKSGKWDIAVQLFQDLNSIDYVYVVNNLKKSKIDSLEQRSETLDAQ